MSMIRPAIVLFLAAIILVSGCASAGALRGSGFPRGEVSVHDIAAKVRDAYRRANYLNIERRTVADGYDVGFRSVMTPRGFDCAIWRDGSTVATIRMRNGRIREHRSEVPVPGMAIPNVVAEYDATEPDGTAGMVLGHEINDWACLVGASFSTWIGPSSETPDILFEHINCGELLGEGQVDGRSVWVVQHDVPPFGERRRDVLYIDKKSGFYLKWETYDVDDGDRADLTHTRYVTRLQTRRGGPALVLRVPPDVRQTALPNQEVMLTE